MFIVSVMKN